MTAARHFNPFVTFDDAWLAPLRWQELAIERACKFRRRSGGLGTPHHADEWRAFLRRPIVRVDCDPFSDATQDDDGPMPVLIRLLATVSLTDCLDWHVKTANVESAMDLLCEDSLLDTAQRIGAALGCMLDGDWIWGPGKSWRPRIEHLIGWWHGFADGDDDHEHGQPLFPIPNLHVTELKGATK